MIRTIRMYNVFFPRKFWMLFTYILYPVIMIVLCAWLSIMTLLTGMVMNLMLSASGIVTVEYLLDTYMFHGVGAKDYKALEYVKSSGRGVHLLQQALLFDGIRRLFTTSVIMASLYWITKMACEKDAGETILEINGQVVSHPSAWIYVQSGVIVMLSVEVGMLITRRSKNILVNLLILYLMSAIACILAMAIMEFASAVSVGVTGILLAIIMVISRKVLVKKVRESFYDEGYKKML